MTRLWLIFIISALSCANNDNPSVLDDNLSAIDDNSFDSSTISSADMNTNEVSPSQNDNMDDHPLYYLIVSMPMLVPFITMIVLLRQFPHNRQTPSAWRIFIRVLFCLHQFAFIILIINKLSEIQRNDNSSAKQYLPSFLLYVADRWVRLYERASISQRGQDLSCVLSSTKMFYMFFYAATNGLPINRARSTSETDAVPAIRNGDGHLLD